MNVHLSNIMSLDDHLLNVMTLDLECVLKFLFWPIYSIVMMTGCTRLVLPFDSRILLHKSALLFLMSSPSHLVYKNIFYFSAKIGLLEDLEDIKMEEEMKKKKLLKKKMRIH